MVDSVLDNLSLRTQRRGDLKLELDVQTNSTKLEAVLAGIKKIMERQDVEEANVLLDSITANAFVIQSDYYTAPVTIKEFNFIKQEVSLQVLKLIEESGVEIAGASTDIRISK
jgi:MscS family membrane protein